MSEPNTSFVLSNAAREGQPWSQPLLSSTWDRRIERVIELKLWDQPLILIAILLLSVLPAISIVTTVW